jgi:HEAT repeat protein
VKPKNNIMGTRITYGARRRHTALLLAGAAMIGLAAGCSSSSPSDQDQSDNFNSFMQGMLSDMHLGSSKSPINEAQNLFDVNDPDVQREAIAWMSEQNYGHNPPYMKAYKLAADGATSPLVQGQAMIALGTSGDPTTAMTLLEGLGSSSDFVRMCAAMGLTYINNPIAAPALIDHMEHDSDQQVRIFCAQALKPYKTREVITTLIDALDDQNVAVVQTAWDDLTAQTGQNLSSDDSDAWRAWFNSHQNEYTG